MIKLTLHHYEDDGRDRPVWVRASSILKMTFVTGPNSYRATEVALGGNQFVTVRETPDEIMAMA